MNEPPATLQSALADKLGDSLRVLARHEAGDWTVAYVRDDLRDAYESDAVNDIAGDLALSTVGNVHQEDLYELGGVRATVRVFEDGVVAHVPTDDRSGYLISVDDEQAFDGRGVVAAVREHAAGTKR